MFLPGCDRLRLIEPSPDSRDFGPPVGNLLEPECLLPVQYNALVRKRGTDDGESRLLLAVLKDALRAYVRNLDGRTEPARRDFLEDCACFNAEDQEGVFAYENVCEALGMEAGLLRKWLRSPAGCGKKEFRSLLPHSRLSQ